MAELNFNAGKQEGMDDYSLVPAGPYNVQVVKSSVEDTKARAEGKKQGQNIKGSLLKLQFKIIDGKFKGRVIFAQYNVDNENQQAVEISRKQMKTLCDAIGKPNGVQDSNEMHNIPLTVKVGIKPASGVYAEQNEIKFYAKYEGPSIEGASGGNGPGNPSSDDESGTMDKQSTDTKVNGDGDANKETKAPWNQ